MVEQHIMWSPGVTLEAIEKQVILKAYNFYRFNKTTTSNALGITIKTLATKLEKYEYEENLEKERQTHAESLRQEYLSRARGNPPNNVGIPYSATENRSHSSSGIPMESSSHASSQSQVPVQKRSKV